MTTQSSFTFDDAEVVPGTGGGGRPAAENPFTGIVAAIALKTTDNGKPVAKSFVVSSDDTEQHVTDLNRVKRQLADAGKANDPAVSVQVRANVETPTRSTVTFWTIKRIVRTKKDK